MNNKSVDKNRDRIIAEYEQLLFYRDTFKGIKTIEMIDKLTEGRYNTLKTNQGNNPD